MFLSWFRTLAMKRMTRAASRRRMANHHPRLYVLSLEERAVPAAPVITSGAQTGSVTELANTTGSSAVDSATGTITFTDADAGDTHVATFMAGGMSYVGTFSVNVPADSTGGVTGSADWQFSVTDSAIDFLAAGQQLVQTYTVTITDNGTPTPSSANEMVTITITGTNDAPTNIALSNSSIAENAGANAVVGTLSATDLDTGDTFTFSLPVGVGDNAAFNISGTSLRANASFDFETTSSYSVTVRVTDQASLTFDKAFTVSVTDVNDAPTIAAPAAATVVQNNDLVFTNISVADVDAGSGSLAVVLTASHGTLTLGSTAGLSGLSGNDTAAVSFSGTLAAVNAALNGLTFHPDANYGGPASLVIGASDQGGIGGEGPLSASRTVAIAFGRLATITNVQLGPIVASHPNQSSLIDRLVVTFSADLAQHPDTAFSLTRADGATVALIVTWNPDFSRATLTFSGPLVSGGSLADGRYRLTVDGDQLFTVDDLAIDADGDNYVGGTFTLDFHRLFGDSDGDGDTDFTDLAQSRMSLGGPSTSPFIAYNPIFDSDGDGDVDFTDLAQFRLRLGTVLS